MTGHPDTSATSPVAAAIDALPPLRDVIARHEMRAEKSLGQNFLLDLNLTAKIVRLAGSLEGMDAIEIGPGPGGLTRNIVRTGVRTLTAIEKDSRAPAVLADLIDAAQGRMRLEEADALTLDLRQYGTDGNRAVLSNLPYNIATPLLTGWLSQIYYGGEAAYKIMILMFQREVADRILAAPGTKAYGRLSIISQLVCDVRRGMDIPPSAFTPPPKVHSSVVVFRPRPPEGARPRLATLEALTAQAFQQRRKMIRVSLKPYVPILETLGIDPSLRAENLSVQEFARIACAIDAGRTP